MRENDDGTYELMGRAYEPNELPSDQEIWENEHGDHRPGDCEECDAWAEAQENKMYTFEEYQEAARKTAVFGHDKAREYTALGLGNEAGEVQGVVKKWLRGDYDKFSTLADGVVAGDVAKELGDVLWYAAAVADAWGLSLETIAGDNIDKLALRQANGTIQGSGDDR